MWPLTMGSGESQWPAGRQSRWIIVAPSQMNWNPLYQCWVAKKVSKPTNDMMVHYSNVMQREWRKLQINVQRQQSAASQTSSKYKWSAHFKPFICTLVSLSCLLSGILKNLSTYTSCKFQRFNDGSRRLDMTVEIVGAATAPTLLYSSTTKTFLPFTRGTQNIFVINSKTSKKDRYRGYHVDHVSISRNIHLIK